MHLVGLYTYSKMMHGVHNVKLINIHVKQAECEDAKWARLDHGRSECRTVVKRRANFRFF